MHSGASSGSSGSASGSSASISTNSDWSKDVLREILRAERNNGVLGDDVTDDEVGVAALSLASILESFSEGQRAPATPFE